MFGNEITEMMTEDDRWSKEKWWGNYGNEKQKIVSLSKASVTIFGAFYFRNTGSYDKATKAASKRISHHQRDRLQRRKYLSTAVHYWCRLDGPSTGILVIIILTLGSNFANSTGLRRNVRLTRKNQVTISSARVWKTTQRNPREHTNDYLAERKNVAEYRPCCFQFGKEISTFISRIKSQNNKRFTFQVKNIAKRRWEICHFG